VAQSLEEPTEVGVLQELRELRLLQFCGSPPKRRGS
jgi:hypothetical protein